MYKMVCSEQRNNILKTGRVAFPYSFTEDVLNGRCGKASTGLVHQDGVTMEQDELCPYAVDPEIPFGEGHAFMICRRDSCTVLMGVLLLLRFVF